MLHNIIDPKINMSNPIPSESEIQQQQQQDAAATTTTTTVPPQQQQQQQTENRSNTQETPSNPTTTTTTTNNKPDTSNLDSSIISSLIQLTVLYHNKVAILSGQTNTN